MKARLTALISDKLLESVRDAVVYLSGPPHMMTLSAFVEEALRNHLTRVGSARIPKRKSELRAGRPIGGSR